MKSSEIRKAFLDFFTQRGHETVPSSSLIPGNDPTLLFTNAGMVQFKDVFLGQEKRKYSRAVSSQRCLRAGGKHNDLDNVGYTARHHTFFEMLGNFSFGDYFKREAIGYAWEFLTKVLQIPTEKLWVTVYRDDDEAADIWLKELGVSKERFSRCGEADNFWTMGDTGPCGPCTEIFYDHGPSVPGGPPGSKEADGDRYIEIWNLVFMQYNRDKEGKLHPLPKPSVDTGMGLERVAAVIQGVHTNYDTDSFQFLIQAVGTLLPGIDLSLPSVKVIVDHIRACAFLISDGVEPNNEGRGYVLRRIIRRAIRHGHKLGLASPFFYQLVEPLTQMMGDAYPELIAKKSFIENLLLQEEEQFAKTIDNGLQLLKVQIANVTNQTIPADVAFKLYDTYGFPLDLTEDIAREYDLVVDVAGFNALMEQQRKQSQASSQFSVDYFSEVELKNVTEFKGYESDQLQSQIDVILKDGMPVSRLVKGERGAIALRETSFYAESGGQVGDKGQLLGEKGTVFAVHDTQKAGSAIVHIGEMMQGELELNQSVEAVVDSQRRNAIRLNHTATHLLHAALKQVIGAHVQQKGSLVDANRCRFDFSHTSALTPSQLRTVESLVNQKIRENIEVVTDNMDIEAAKKSGAVALFGEKYQDVVRVLTLGQFSKELCGGTHARRTGDIGLFKIIDEYGIASGIRRIEMVTGEYALDWVNQQQDVMNELSLKLKTTPEKCSDKLSQLLQESKQQAKLLTSLQQKLAAESGQTLMHEIQKVGDVNVLIKRLENQDMQGLRTMLDQLKSSLDTAVIVLYAINTNKISVVASISKSLIGKVPPASAYVVHLCGKGGGRDDMAQGGGELPADLDQRVDEIVSMIKR